MFLWRENYSSLPTRTVKEFYGKVSHTISLLLNNLCINETNGSIRASKERFYQEIALKVFLAGLREPLGPIIRARNYEGRLSSEESNYNYVRHPFKSRKQSPIAIQWIDHCAIHLSFHEPFLQHLLTMHSSSAGQQIIAPCWIHCTL